MKIQNPRSKTKNKNLSDTNLYIVHVMRKYYADSQYWQFSLECSLVDVWT